MHSMKQTLERYGVIALLFAIVLASSMAVFVHPAKADWTSIKPSKSRLKVSTAANWILTFTGSDANNWDAGETLILDLDNDYDTSTLAASEPEDFDIKLEGTDESIVATGGCSTNDAIEVTTVDPTNDVITFTACGSFTAPSVTGELDVEIEIGTNATFGSAGNDQITNPSAAGSNQHTIAGTVDPGTGTDASFATATTEDDQVTLSASVDATITFDVDTGTTNTANNNGPHTVALGTLSSSTLTTSDQSAINSIFIDISTNAVAGAVVQVRGLNTGLVSTNANPDKTITLPTNEESIAAGSEEIGLCVESVTQVAGGPLAAGTQYDSTGGACSLTNTGTQVVGKILTTATEIFNTTGAAIDAGRGEILVKASISGLTPPAPDYSNTVTLLATGTF